MITETLTEEIKEETIEQEPTSQEMEDNQKKGRPKGVKNKKTVWRAKRAERKAIEAPKVSFLEIETTNRGTSVSLNIYNENPAYVYRWCAKNKMANNRRGIWHTVKREHPDFDGLRVEIDHSPEQSFFSCGDLILCCARKETIEAIRKQKREMIITRDQKIDRQTTEVMARVSKEGISSLSKKTMDMIEI